MLYASENLERVLDGFQWIAPYVLISFVLLYITRVFHDKVTSFDDDAESVRGNGAAGLNRGGIYIGIILAQLGTFIHNSTSSDGERLAHYALNGAVAVVVFIVASYALDWVVLRKVDNCKALEAGNTAVGVVEASAYISLGLLMAAAFAGDDASFREGLFSAIVFSFVGLASLLAVYFVYVTGWHWRTGVNIDTEVGKNNLAAAIDASALLLSTGFLLACSIAGDSVGWFDDFESYGLAAVLALVSVSAVRLGSFLLLPSALRAAGGSEGTASHHGNNYQANIRWAVTVGLALVAGLAIAV